MWNIQPLSKKFTVGKHPKSVWLWFCLYVGIGIGVGIGMEFMLTQNVGLALELPVVVMIGVGEAGNFGIYPIPNASLIYYF